MLRPIFLTAACLASALTVAAASPSLAETTIVRTRGLDLASSDGRAALNRRIAIAAHRVCGTNGVQPLAARMAERACVAETITSTRMQVATAGGPALALAR